MWNVKQEEFTINVALSEDLRPQLRRPWDIIALTLSSTGWAKGESRDNRGGKLSRALPLLWNRATRFPSSSIKPFRGWDDSPLNLSRPGSCLPLATGGMYWIAMVWEIHQISPFSLLKCWKSDFSCCQLSVSSVVWNRFSCSQLLKLTLFGTAPTWSQTKIFYEMLQTNALQCADPVMSRAFLWLSACPSHNNSISCLVLSSNDHLSARDWS